MVAVRTVNALPRLVSMDDVHQLGSDQNQAEVTHHHLWTELKLLEKELSSIRGSVERIAGDHDRQLQEMRAELKAQAKELGEQRFKLGQVFAVSATLALVVPVVVNSLNPRLQLGEPATHQAQ